MVRPVVESSPEWKCTRSVHNRSCVDEPVIVSQNRGHLCLLKHNLGHPNRVGAPVIVAHCSLVPRGVHDDMRVTDHVGCSKMNRRYLLVDLLAFRLLHLDILIHEPRAGAKGACVDWHHTRPITEIECRRSRVSQACAWHIQQTGLAMLPYPPSLSLDPRWRSEN